MSESFISNYFMERAIELAKKGGGKVHPNPLVGAVIVRNGEIVSEGFHHEYGNLHAERDALKNARENNIDVSGCDMYVTLEPCCHQGKQPPCTQAVIESGISRVIIGSRDPNSLVNGKGVEALRKAGIEVVQDFMKDECDSLNDIFFHYIRTGMPYVAIKSAVTADGKTALSSGESKWITGESSRKHVHFLRGNYSCIMTGINTVLADDPMLNSRIDCEGIKNPARLVIDSRLEIPFSSRLVRTASEIPLVVFTLKNQNEEKKNKLKEKSVLVVEVDPDCDGHVDLDQVLIWLGKNKYDSVLVESGGLLNSALLCRKKCLVNRLYLFIAPKIFGGTQRPRTCVQGIEVESIENCVRLSEPKVTLFDGDVLLDYKIGSEEK